MSGIRAFLLLNLLVFLTGFEGLAVPAASIDFSGKSWTEVKREAGKQGKFIFVDFYADWCGPCKYMSKKVFTDPEVAAFYNENFISFKVNAETQEKELVESMKLQAYPTLGFFDPDGNLMLKYVGVLEKEEMLEKARQILNFSANEQKVEQGNTDITILKDYLVILKDKDYDKAVKTGKNYLSGLSDDQLKDPEHWFFISNFAWHYTSREFNYIVNHPEEFTGNEEFPDYYRNGIKTLMVEAVEQKDYEKVLLHKKYHIQVYKALNLLRLPEDYYTRLIDIMYFDGINDTLKYFNSLSTWMSMYNLENARALTEGVLKVVEKLNDKKALETALSWSDTAISLEENYATRYARASVLNALGRKEEAIKEAEKALEICSDPGSRQFLQEFMDTLK